MKKIFMTVAVIATLGFGAANASASIAPQTVTEVVADDQFKAVELDQLPQEIKDAVAKNYEGQTIKSASVKEENGAKTFKVTISDNEGKTTDVLFNEKGEVIPA